MGNYILSDRLDTNCALAVSLSPTSVTITASTVAIRDGNAAQAPLPSYLDFGDGAFKTAGWATQRTPLTALVNNYFALDGGLNVSAITNLPVTTRQLYAEYELTRGGRIFTDNDMIQLSRGESQCHLGITYNGASVVMEGWMERNGEKIVAPLSMAIVWYNQDGTILFTEAGPGTIDAQGHVLITRVQALLAGQDYYAEMTMTDARGTLRTDRAIPFNAAP